jgi:hypothetical protein
MRKPEHGSGNCMVGRPVTTFGVYLGRNCLVPVECGEPVSVARPSKNAKAMRDAKGTLVAWRPDATTE